MSPSGLHPSRRQTALGLAMLTVFGPGRTAAATATARSGGLTVGAQIFPFIQEVERDRDGTLRAIAALGVRQIEMLAGLGQPDAMARSLRACGLQAPCVHASATTLFPGVPSLDSDFDRVVAYCRAVGATTLVCSTPWFKAPLGGRSLDDVLGAFTADDWSDHARFLVRTAAAARQAGLSFAYHNHMAEFRPVGTTTGFAIIVNGTAGHDIAIELDCGWAFAGGADPAALIRKHADRIRFLHLKDVVRGRPLATEPAVATVPVGSGSINWKPVIAAARAAGVTTAFVEQEGTSRGAPIRDLQASLRHLYRLGVQV